jgi:type II secretory pathway pseudopilin PulG
MPARPTPRRSGALRPAAFTLLEVIMAVCIMALTSTLLYPLVVTSQRVDVSSRDRLAAMGFARETMEDLRSLSFEALRTRTAGLDPLPEGHYFVTVLAGLREYRVEAVPVTPQEEGLKITVSVTWDAHERGDGFRNEERLVLLRTSALEERGCP